MVLRIGTSGWQYADWRGAFYPPTLRSADWLGAYAEVFATVELNNSFYRLPEAERFTAWGRATPRGFSFAVKASRYLTHVRRLRDPAEPVARLLGRARRLGAKLGPVLLQLPPTMRVDVDRLQETLARFPRRVRVAVEPRHPSWFVDDVFGALAERDAALCATDRLGRPGPIERTASWCYVRLHEGRGSPHPCYGRAALARWVERVAATWGERPDGYVYFNNDARACAPKNARDLIRLCERAGLEVATPSRRR